MGVPGIIITLAENQRLIAEYFSRNLHYTALGESDRISEEDIIKAICLLLSDYDTRIKISQTARKYNDGNGANRVIREMNNL